MPLKISILTLFPEMFEGPFNHSIIKRAIDKELIKIEYINIRNFGMSKHRIVDDKPYGGGAGMLMRVDVLDKAIQYVKGRGKKETERIILLDPQGKKFSQKEAKRLTKYKHLILICGRYEGIDERIRDFVDEELSIGDYVLTGGEIPAMAVTDAIVRLLPKVLGKDESSHHESFEENLLEYPQYTRPEVYKNKKVPSLLLSGNHSEILEWRKHKAIGRTKKRRPDLVTPGR